MARPKHKTLSSKKIDDLRRGQGWRFMFPAENLPPKWTNLNKHPPMWNPNLHTTDALKALDREIKRFLPFDKIDKTDYSPHKKELENIKMLKRCGIQTELDALYYVRIDIVFAVDQAKLQETFALEKIQKAKARFASITKEADKLRKLDLLNIVGNPTEHPEYRSGRLLPYNIIDQWDAEYENDLREIMLLERVISALDRRAKDQEDIANLVNPHFRYVLLEEFGRIWYDISGKIPSHTNRFVEFCNAATRCLGFNDEITPNVIRTVVERVKRKSRWSQFDGNDYLLGHTKD